MSEVQVLSSGHGLVESVRWHEGRVWFADWFAQQILALDSNGNAEVMAQLDYMPSCFDWLPDGRLIVTGPSGLLTLDGAATVQPHADLSGISPFGWNDIVVDSHGNVYANNIGFDFPGGEFKPGCVALVRPDGKAEQVADGLAFPNGMAVTADGSTLIVAESYAFALTAFDIADDGSLSNRRLWASLGEGVAPDGICIGADDSVWFATVPGERCVRVAQGGAVLQTVEMDRGCFDCALGGDDGSTLYLVGAAWGGTDGIGGMAGSGQVQALELRRNIS